jgi:hypothetical protein
MPDDPRARRLTPTQQVIVEQGVINLCLHEGITILRGGHDITPDFLAQAKRVNDNFDALHAPRKASPAAMPTKKADPPKVRPPRQRRTSL